jgi:SnoaL-like domain
MAQQGMAQMSSDERAILNLLGRYCELQDAADFEAVADLFRSATYGAEGGPDLVGELSEHLLDRANHATSVTVRPELTRDGPCD